MTCIRALWRTCVLAFARMCLPMCASVIGGLSIHLLTHYIHFTYINVGMHFFFHVGLSFFFFTQVTWRTQNCPIDVN